MTHAFFKALLFLCSGAVIHAMAGEQNMLKMGGLKKHMPITFWTMMIGAVAIAGIPPFAGFFSKDEILLQAFLKNKFIYGGAALAALMTAFYMFRLMSLTFFGAYRGPAWEHGHTGQEAGATPVALASPASHGGHGAWHGPHEAPRAMTYVLIALAVGAVLAGFVGVPKALGGGNTIEEFLHPSFYPVEARVAGQEAGATPVALASSPAGGSLASSPAEGEAAEISQAGELGLMALSVLIGLLGIGVAWRVYVRKPEIAAMLKARFAGPHRVLTNKYYVDELYDATVIRGTMASATGLWAFDRTVVDGAVNGSGWLTIFTSWFSGILDKYIVDGLVNLVGSIAQESSFVIRRLQTGLIQNYALLMLVGVFAFVSLYLLMVR
jgi:NADH-quinone oxidoreductase subunit L